MASTAAAPRPVRRGRLSGARTIEDRELIRRAQQEPDSRVFSETLEAFMPLARSLARRYHRGEEPLDDLEQVAALGLLKAMRGFDCDRGKSFAAYAVPTIVGELRRHFRDKGWGIHVPRGLQETALLVQRDSEVLATALGRAPTVKEIAAKVGRSEEEVLEAREAFRAMRPASLDRPAAPGGEDEEHDLLSRIGGVDPGFERAEDSATLATLMERLPNRERRLLSLRYEEDLTQSEIGERMGISQMHVSRLLRRTIDHLEQRAAA
jgi:RNA polymerase sigma-B factor